jgi:hypothetical protein
LRSCKSNTFFEESSRISTHLYLAHHLSCLSTKASGRLSPFKPCGHCCHELLITATATPLSPPFGDSGRQGREVVTSVEGQPHHTPRGPGTLPFPLVKDTALILTRRAGQVCSACHSIRFRAVSRFTVVVRESPFPLCLLFLDTHGNRKMFLPMAGICCRCRGVCSCFQG